MVDRLKTLFDSERAVPSLGDAFGPSSSQDVQRDPVDFPFDHILPIFARGRSELPVAHQVAPAAIDTLVNSAVPELQTVTRPGAHLIQAKAHVASPHSIDLPSDFLLDGIASSGAARSYGGVAMPQAFIPVLLPATQLPLQAVGAQQSAFLAHQSLTHLLTEPQGHPAVTPAGGAAAQVDPEIWIAATQGGDQNLIIHGDDDGTGSGTATNVNTLFTPISANNPSLAAHIDGVDMVQLDTQDNVYVIKTEHNADPATIRIGSLSGVLASPSSTPTFTTLFSDSNASDALTGLAVDPDNATVYFVDTQSFEKVGYGGGTVTNLDTAGVFLDGLALDLPHHVAYFASATSGTTTTTNGSGVHYHTGVTSNSIYETSNLTNASSSVSISKLADIPTTDGAIFDGVGDAGITVDTTTGTIYFTTKTINGVGEGGIWSMDPSSHVVTKIYQQTGAANTLNNGIMDSIVVDHATNEYFVSIINHNGAGGGIYVGHLGSTAAPTLWETLPSYSSGTIVPSPRGFSLDNAPTLSSVTGGGNYALQGGSAVLTLSADGTFADTDNDKGDGATISITNPQSGDLLEVGGAQSGTLDGGKISFSYNSTTHTMTLFGTDSFVEYQTVIDLIQFQDSGTDNSTGSHPTRTITYSVYDGLLSSTVGGATTITQLINRAPTLVADSFTAQESGSASGTAGTGGTGVLGNDSDKDGDAISVSAVAGSAGNVGSGTFQGTYGHLNLASTGAFTYTADNTSAIDGAANGSHPVDSIAYTIFDGINGTTTGTVSFTLNRAPTMVADAGTAVESASGTGNVLTNDSDKDGDSLTVSAVAGGAGNVGASVAGTYGHVTIAANGSYTYTADNTAAIDGATTGSHLTDTFSYTASDGHGGATTTNLVITLDRAPTVVADTGAAVESASGTGNVLTNDSDRDADSLTVSTVAGLAGNVGASVAGTYGHLTLNANGSYSYNADKTSAIDGAAIGSHLTDTFSYTASDGHGGTTTTNLVVTLDRAPTVVADTGTAVESASGTGNVLTNDSDRDADSLTVSAVVGLAGNVGNSVAGTYGHLTIAANGSYTYSADNTTAIGSAATGSHLTDTFSYTASDGHGGTTNTNLVVTLDRAPTVVADAVAAVESASGTGNVLTNDSDRDGDSLTVSAVAGLAGNVGSSVAGTYGHLTLNANGNYSYNADNTAAIDGAASGSHLADTFFYTASDGHGGTISTDLVVTLDRAPTVVSDSANVAESATASANAAVGVLSNDNDRDGDSLTVSAVAGLAGNVGASIAGTYGHLTLNADGGYSYVADIISAINAAAQGTHPVDSFAYTASDGDGGTTNSTLSFAIDRPAIADNDAFTTDQATAIGAGLNVFNNNGSGADHDPDGSGVFSVTAVTGGTVGTQFTLPSGALLTVDGDGTFAYDPNHVFDNLHLAAPGSGASNTSTTDTFTYTITGGATAVATVTVNGTDNANTIYEGSGGNDTVTGDATLPDLFHLEQGGNDHATGGAGDDGFYFGGAFTAGDTVNGGGGTNNQIGLEGDYSGGLTLGASTIANIQVIACLPGFSYNLTTVDANVAAGQTLTIWAAHLGAGNTLTFNGSAELDGKFTVFGGAGNDVIAGGAGNDTFYGLGGADILTGHGGADRFIYTNVSESTGNAHGTAYDTITDFAAGADRFDLPVLVNGVDTAIAIGALTSASFDVTLAAAVNATGLAANHAVLFAPDAGDYAGHTFLVVDANGTAGYQAGADFVFDVTGGTLAGLNTGDFI